MKKLLHAISNKFILLMMFLGNEWEPLGFPLLGVY